MLKKHGKRFQIRKLQEECCELGTAINHLLTGRGKGKESFYEEFADVEILMEQIKTLMNQKLYNKHKEAKLNRLKKRVKNNGKPNGKKQQNKLV